MDGQISQGGMETADRAGRVCFQSEGSWLPRTDGDVGVVKKLGEGLGFSEDLVVVLVAVRDGECLDNRRRRVHGRGRKGSGWEEHVTERDQEDGV